MMEDVPCLRSERTEKAIAARRNGSLSCSATFSARSGGSMSTCSIRLWTSMVDIAPSTMRSIAAKVHRHRGRWQSMAPAGNRIGGQIPRRSAQAEQPCL